MIISKIFHLDHSHSNHVSVINAKDAELYTIWHPSDPVSRLMWCDNLLNDIVSLNYIICWLFCFLDRPSCPETSISHNTLIMLWKYNAFQCKQTPRRFKQGKALVSNRLIYKSDDMHMAFVCTNETECHFRVHLNTIKQSLLTNRRSKNISRKQLTGHAVDILGRK